MPTRILTHRLSCIAIFTMLLSCLLITSCEGYLVDRPGAFPLTIEGIDCTLTFGKKESKDLHIYTADVQGPQHFTVNVKNGVYGLPREVMITTDSSKDKKFYYYHSNELADGFNLADVHYSGPWGEMSVEEVAEGEYRMVFDISENPESVSRQIRFFIGNYPRFAYIILNQAPGL